MLFMRIITRSYAILYFRASTRNKGRISAAETNTIATEETEEISRQTPPLCQIRVIFSMVSLHSKCISGLKWVQNARRVLRVIYLLAVISFLIFLFFNYSLNRMNSNKQLRHKSILFTWEISASSLPLFSWLNSKAGSLLYTYLWIYFAVSFRLGMQLKLLYSGIDNPTYSQLLKTST